MLSFALKIVTPGGTVYDGKCDSVVFPGPDGLYGIQANHSPMAALVSPGDIKITVDGKTVIRKTESGFLKCKDNSVIICSGSITE